MDASDVDPEEALRALLGAMMSDPTQIPRFSPLHDNGLALEHLRDVQDSPNVRKLMKSLGAPKLIGSAQKFTGFFPLLSLLDSQGAATDQNLALLFGKASRVKSLLAEVRESERGSDHSHFAHQAAACSYCLQQTGPLRKCAGCQLARYCCTKHQSAHWKIHRILCFETQKKAISEKMRDEFVTASNILTQELNMAVMEKMRARENDAEAPRQSLEEFKKIGPKELRDCDGKVRWSDLPAVPDLYISLAADAQGFRVEKSFNLVHAPPGIESENARGFHLMSLENGISVVVMLTRLFSFEGPGGMREGCGTDGIYVRKSGAKKFALVNVKKQIRPLPLQAALKRIADDTRNEPKKFNTDLFSN